MNWMNRTLMVLAVALLGLCMATMLATAQPTDTPGQDATPKTPESDDVPSVINAMNSPNSVSTSVVRKRMPANSDLSPEFVDRCLEVADELDSAFAEHLRSLCEVDPAEFERIIRRQGPRLTGLAELKGSDPQLYQLKLVELRVDAAVQRLAIELRAMERETPQNTERIESLTSQLQGQLQIRLGLEMGNQMLYIDRMQEQLKLMREHVEAQRANFDAVVERELDLLLGRLDPVEAARPVGAPGSAPPIAPSILFPAVP